MASSIFGGSFGNSTWDGSTLNVTGAFTSSGSITTTTGSIVVGSGSAGIGLSGTTLQIRPADGGGYLSVATSGAGVAINSANLLLQNGGVTRAQVSAPASNQIALLAANGTSSPTLLTGASTGAAAFGPSAVASLTVVNGVVTAAS